MYTDHPDTRAHAYDAAFVFSLNTAMHREALCYPKIRMAF